VRRRAHDIGAWLRRRNDDVGDEVQALNLELCDIATRTIVEARRVAVNARRGVRDCEAKASGKAMRAIAELERCAGLVEQIAAQTRLRTSGVTPDGSTRVVSLHDPDARPIAKGRLGRPVEFGYKAQVVDNEDGLVLDHGVLTGNPPDAPMLAPAITRIIGRFGRAPRIVTADRGYGEAGVEADLKTLKVRQVAIPRKGKPGAARQKIERARWFRREVKWRTGSEARINCLKRDNGWRRTLFDTRPGPGPGAAGESSPTTRPSCHGCKPRRNGSRHHHPDRPANNPKGGPREVERGQNGAETVPKGSKKRKSKGRAGQGPGEAGPEAAQRLKRFRFSGSPPGSVGG